MTPDEIRAKVAKLREITTARGATLPEALTAGKLARQLLLIIDPYPEWHEYSQDELDEMERFGKELGEIERQADELFAKRARSKDTTK